MITVDSLFPPLTELITAPATEFTAELTDVNSSFLSAHNIQLKVLRLDKLHPQISGNKFFKLKHNLRYAKSQGLSRVLSFGGAYSNHLHALAYAGRELGLQTIAVVRGEAGISLNPTLADARHWGMQLEFVSRADYRLRNDADFLSELEHRFGPCHIIPEGGANRLGVLGCREILAMLDGSGVEHFEWLTLPCGTASTLAGLVAALAPGQQVMGFSVLKGAQYLTAEVQSHLASLELAGLDNWQINYDFHCGGYARLNTDLVQFMDAFYHSTAIPLEPVYSAKHFLGLYQSIAAGVLPTASRIVALHTGGLQGMRGMQPACDRLRDNNKPPAKSIFFD